MELKAWLESCGCVNVRNCRVTIGNESWRACDYEQVHEYTSDMMACTHGGIKPGTKYVTRSIYCLGDLPTPYRKRREKVCFPMGDGMDWYVKGYIEKKSISPQFEQFHPLGANFMVGPWDIKGEKIDQYERKPYDRVTMSVEYFD